MHVGLEDGGVIGGGLHKLGAFYAERCVEYRPKFTSVCVHPAYLPAGLLFDPT